MEEELVADEARTDQVEWSRAWEWPAWMRDLGAGARELRGWHLDGRTFALLVGLYEASLLAQIVPNVAQFWRALTTTPQTPFGPEPGYTWERVAAAAYLGDGLAALVTILGAVAVLLAPRRLAGYVVVAAGLALRVASQIGLTVAEAHVNAPASFIIGAGVSCGLILVLAALAVRTARHRRTP